MQRFKNILCVVNTKLNDTSALEHAAKLAANNQASLTVVEVIDEIPPNTTLLERTLSPVDLQEKIVMEHQKKLEEIVLPWSKKIEIKSKLLTGTLFLEVIYEVLVKSMILCSSRLKMVVYWIACSVVMICICCENVLARYG